MNIHLILSTKEKGLEKIISKLDGVVIGENSVDYDMDNAVRWAKENPDKAPDVVLCFEWAPASTYDVAATKFVSKTQAFLNCLYQIKLAWGSSRIVVIIRQDRLESKSDEFLQKLIALGIYDIWPAADKYTKTDIGYWIKTKKTFADVAKWLGKSMLRG